MAIVKLDQQLKRIGINEFEIDNEITFGFFNKLPASERDDQLFRAIYIGVLALLEDRLSSFFAKTSNELGTELESLKMIFEMKKELFFKTAIKGVLAEEEIAAFIQTFLDAQGLADKLKLMGNVTGKLPKNKTGDILCYVDGNENSKIVIECKFDKSIKLGNIQAKDIFTKNADTVWGQLIEAQANREGSAAIIVLDISLIDNNVLSAIQNVRYIPSVGFVSIIDSQKGDYSNLTIAYMLAREVALRSKTMEMDTDTLAIIVNRIVKDLNEILKIKNLVISNIENNKNILSQLSKVMLLMEFNQQYLAKFLRDGFLSKSDLLNFYSGEDVRDKFKLIENDIKEMS